MDVSNDESDIPDLLEFLRPSVNKFCGSVPRFTNERPANGETQIHQSETTPNIIVTVQKSSNISSLGTISDVAFENSQLLSDATVNSNVSSSILCISKESSNATTRTITKKPSPLGDVSFLTITGLLPSNNLNTQSLTRRRVESYTRKNVTNVPIKKLQPVVRTIFTTRDRGLKIRRAVSTKAYAKTVECLEMQSNCDPKSISINSRQAASSRTLGIQTDLISHESRRVFVRKVRKICPGSGEPPEDSNVFILLTDATGESVFTVNTKAARKKRNPRQSKHVSHGDVPLRHHYYNNCFLEKMDTFKTDKREKRSLKNKIKRHFSKNSIKSKDNQPLHVNSTNSIRSSSNLLMLNASTQTTEKYLAYKFRPESAVKQPEKKNAIRETKIKPTVSHVRLTGRLSKTSDGIVLHYLTTLEDNTSNPDGERDSTDDLTAGRHFKKDDDPVVECTHFTHYSIPPQKSEKSKVIQVNPSAERRDLSIQTDIENHSDSSKRPAATIVQSRMVTNSTQINFKVLFPKKVDCIDRKQTHKDVGKAVIRIISNESITPEKFIDKSNMSNMQLRKNTHREKSTLLMSVVTDNARKIPIENRLKGTQVSDTFLERKDSFGISTKEPAIAHQFTNTDICMMKRKVNLTTVDAPLKADEIAMNSNRRKDVTNHRESDKLKLDFNPISNVKINIEGVKECYNVSIQHTNDRSQNVTIRTMMKSKPKKELTMDCKYLSNDSTASDNKSLSMKNFLQRPFKRDAVHPSLRRSFSGTVLVKNEAIESSGGSTSSELSFEKQTSNFDLGQRRDSTNFQPVTTVYHTAVIFGPNAGKHYRGDNCSLKDPVERDREIRHLLGVDRRFRPTGSKSQPTWPSQLNVDWAAHSQTSRKHSSLYSHRVGGPEKYVETKLFKCKKFQCRLCCTRRTRQKPEIHYSSVATQHCFRSDQTEMLNRTRSSTATTTMPSDLLALKYKPTRSNVCKHRPIRISQSEYEMIKKSVCGTIMKRKSDYPKTKRVISFKKTKLLRSKSVLKITPKYQLTATAVNYLKADYDDIYKCYYPGLTKDTKYSCHSCNMRTHTALYQLNVETQTFGNSGELEHLCSLCRLERMRKNVIICNTDCTVMTLQRHRRIRHRNTSLMIITPPPLSRRNAISSIELHESNVACRLVTYSLSNIKRIQSAARAARIESVLTQNEWAQSTMTLYKASKKDATRFSPNFGTSTFTLCSQKDSRVFNDEQPFGSRNQVDAGVIKKNKSFFKKLVMFLHKKPSKDVACQPENDRLLWSEPQYLATADSSIDSYHINTSFEEFEISSSLYDTSASNFSQHTIIPVAQTRDKPKKSIVKKMKSYLKRTSN